MGPSEGALGSPWVPLPPVGPFGPLGVPWCPWGWGPWGAFGPKGSAPCRSEKRASRKLGGGTDSTRERINRVGGMRQSVYGLYRNPSVLSTFWSYEDFVHG